jgi:hypothetical protein
MLLSPYRLTLMGEIDFLIFEMRRIVTFCRRCAQGTHAAKPSGITNQGEQTMRKLALILSTFGFIAFAGMARADQKTENTEKTDTTTTLGGKHKTTKTKKVERADGSSVETKTETVTPKTDADKRDTTARDNTATPVRHDEAVRADGKTDATVKSEEHTTLTGKKEHKTTKKVENADGSHTETTTTTTEPKR